jgi:vancomycin permeability regulator SanA
MKKVIICLGDTFLKPRTIENMKLRTEKAVDLYKQEQTKIIFTGGFKTNKDLSEAKFMAEYAVKLGVAEVDIILEEQANTTIGNAVYCKKILADNSFESAIVVTSPHHLRRSKYIFKKVMPDKKLEFRKCKNNLSFLEFFQYNFNEIKILIGLIINGIDYTKI